MTTLMVTYDLHNPGRDYTKIHNAIKQAYPTYAKPTESLWLIVTSQTPADVRDYLKAYIDTNDSLAVISVQPNGAWATTGVTKPITDWMYSRI